MCDYDVKIVKVILYVGSILLVWFGYSFYYNDLPKIRERVEIQKQQEKEFYRELVKDFSSSMKVDVKGYLIEPTFKMGVE